MSDELLGTGVVLRPPSRAPDEAAAPAPVDARGDVVVELQVFAELSENGTVSRTGGSVDRQTVAAGTDPTTRLIEIALDAREVHLGDLLGDVRNCGHDITRFEFYAAPFRIELAPSLRERFESAWRERPPRV